MRIRWPSHRKIGFALPGKTVFVSKWDPLRLLCKYADFFHILAPPFLNAWLNITAWRLWQVIIRVLYFYAAAFRGRRYYVFGLSVRPSVRPKPEIPSFDLYMGPLVHLTNCDRFTACPSVRPSVRRGFRAFAGERMKGIAWNFTCWCVLVIFRTD